MYACVCVCVSPTRIRTQGFPTPHCRNKSFCKSHKMRFQLNKKQIDGRGGGWWWWWWWRRLEPISFVAKRPFRDLFSSFLPLYISLHLRPIQERIPKILKRHIAFSPYMLPLLRINSIDKDLFQITTCKLQICLYPTFSCAKHWQQWRWEAGKWTSKN